MSNSFYDISQAAVNSHGTTIQFLDISTNSDFIDVNTDPSGRIGRRLQSTEYNYILQWIDISINYSDPSWNFYAALDKPNVKWAPRGIITNGDGSTRYPKITIFDICYNKRAPYVPKLWDISGGSVPQIGIEKLYSEASGNLIFNWVHALGAPQESLPVTGGGGTIDISSSSTGWDDISGQVLTDISDNSANIHIIASKVTSTDASLNKWFFDPPKIMTNENIRLWETNPAIPSGPMANQPYLDMSWNNPTQERAAFNYVGGNPGPPDVSSNDKYNYLPYFQGVKLEYKLFDSKGDPLGTSGILDWSAVPQIGTGVNGIPAEWRDKTFLPRHVYGVWVFGNGASGAPDQLQDGQVDNPFGRYIFALPATWNGAVTAGCRVRIRAAMVNGAEADIPDPDHIQTPTDVSWNWIYMPEDPSGSGLGEYGEPTAPLTFNALTGTYKSMDLSGGNYNDGTDGLVTAFYAIVEKGLLTPFRVLPSSTLLPRVRYRYDLSGSKLISSKQVGGNTLQIDVSYNNPPTDISANWSDSNNWAQDLSGVVIFPEHKYSITNYSMRHSLDPSRNTTGYRDASLNSVIAGISSYNTPRPIRLQSTSIYSEYLPNTTIDSTFTSIPVGYNDVTARKASVIDADVGSLVVTAFLDPADNISLTHPTTYKFCANTADYPAPVTSGMPLIGNDSSGQYITQIRSKFVNASYSLNGQMYKGFTEDALSVAQNPSDAQIEWSSSALINAYDLGTINHEGGYYLGIDLSNIKIKNVTLTTFPDISNNTTPYTPYQFKLNQAMRTVMGPPVDVPGDGVNKVFSIGARSQNDISFNTASTEYQIFDGYNNTSVYTTSHNNFQWGSGTVEEQKVGTNADFFGLPNLNPSNGQAFLYRYYFSDLDSTWYPGDTSAPKSNMLDNFNLMFQNDSNTDADVVWDVDQVLNAPWSAASTSGFPPLWNVGNTYTGNADLSSNFALTSAGFASRKYSRDFLDTGFTAAMSTVNPVFRITGTYDNNILRANRGGSGVEAGGRRAISSAYFKGVGPNGNFSLFWDNTFNTSVLFQKVGEIGAAPYNVYPFVNFGTAPDYGTIFDHSVNLESGSEGQRQLIWAKDGFKHGEWSTAKERPYVSYSTYFWMGGSVPGPPVTQPSRDYSANNITGEALSFSFTSAQWWSGNVLAGGMNFADTYKFLVIKVNTPATFATEIASTPGSVGQVSIEIKKSGGSYAKMPLEYPTGPGGTISVTKPLAWLQEHNTGDFTVPLTLPAGYPAGRSGWKATHIIWNAGLSGPLQNSNNAGCFDNASYLSGYKQFKLYSTSSSNPTYFRIGLPNNTGNTEDIQEIRIQFSRRNPDNSITTIGIPTEFTWLQ